MCYPKSQRQRLSMPRILRSYSTRSDSMPKRAHVLFFFLALWIGTAAAYGQASTPARTASVDPASLPARDSHQGLLIAADPYMSADRYKEKFGKHSPYDGGIIAIELFLR